MPQRSPSATGRPAKYCRRSCRQRQFEARSKAAGAGLSDDELVVARNELDDLNDRLYEIRLLCEEARIQAQDRWDPSEVLERLLDAAESVIGTN